VDLDQTKRVLAKIALIDNRTADLAVLHAWHETIGHLDYRDALRAVTMHRQRSTEYLQPAHIIRMAAEAKREREIAEARERARHALPAPPPKPIPPHIKAMFHKVGNPTPTGSTTQHPGNRPHSGPQTPNGGREEKPQDRPGNERTAAEGDAA
jgi:hypothetical protein